MQVAVSRGDHNHGQPCPFAGVGEGRTEEFTFSRVNKCVGAENFAQYPRGDPLRGWKPNGTKRIASPFEVREELSELKVRSAASNLLYAGYMVSRRCGLKFSRSVVGKTRVMFRAFDEFETPPVNHAGRACPPCENHCGRPAGMKVKPKSRTRRPHASDSRAPTALG